jgi:hypothetical protein
MGKRGPASGFEPEYCNLARKFCMLGATTEDLAGLFEVHRNTITNWMNDVPAFKEAVQQGRDVADANLAERLYQRGMGYEKPAVKFFNTRNGIERIDYTEHLAPDTGACIFWLRNRRRKQWREKIEHEHTSTDVLVAALEAACERARNARRR